MTKFKNNSVLITGGASGIGRMLGKIALEKGAKCLIIWDINEQNIESTIKEFQPLGKVAGYKIDVSNSSEVENIYKKTQQACGNVDILINCAGIVTGNKTFDKLSVSDIERTMNINATAPMVIALQVLEDMIRRDKGHICNIASAAGMLAIPKMSVYAASKWAIVGWTDSLRIELKQQKSNVRVTTIAPYFIKTGMFNGATSRVCPMLNPEYVVKRIVRAIETNKSFKGIPFGFHFIRFWQAILPVALFDFVFGTIFGVYHAMDKFVGKK